MLTQPVDPEKNSLNFIFPTQYVIPKSLKFGHWLSENGLKQTDYCSFNPTYRGEITPFMAGFSGPIFVGSRPITVVV